jgi:2-polyprenyl-3-methyl-5-hydroxy-6-metoxy-1,4-benzoquinol methylase
MELEQFYRYQAKARRITSLADVRAMAAFNTRLYDTVILPWLPEDLTAPLYEAACGPGVLLSWLASRGYRNISGSDFSDVQIELARSAGFNVKVADSIAELRLLAPNSLQGIVALDFYEHLSKEAFLDFIHECSRTLRLGGRLILRGPNGDSPVVGRALYNDITHVTTYTSIAFTALLEMAGFSRTEFRDDTLASIPSHRWLRIPIAWTAQRLLGLLIRLATREKIECLSASFFLCAWKQ